MKILEFLASQLDREATQFDNQNTISENLDFWQLCLECRRQFNEEHKKEYTLGGNVKNK